MDDPLLDGNVVLLFVLFDGVLLVVLQAASRGPRRKNSSRRQGARYDVVLRRVIFSCWRFSIFILLVLYFFILARYEHSFFILLVNYICINDCRAPMGSF